MSKSKETRMATTLQSFYKGRRTRRKLSLLFYPLPYELRNLVLFYMRFKYYVERVRRSLRTVVERRVRRVANRTWATAEDRALFVSTLSLIERFSCILPLCLFRDGDLRWIRFVARHGRISASRDET